MASRVGWRYDLGEAAGADAVGDGVVDLPHQRGPATLQTLDEVEHPQRAGAVVGVLVDRRHEVEQLALGARRRQGDLADVVVEVELRVGPPDGRAEAARGRPRPARAGAARSATVAAMLGPEVVEVGRPVEHDERAAVGVEPRVLLDVPHQRLGVGHPPLEALLPRRALARPWRLLSLLRCPCRGGVPTSRVGSPR